MTVRLCTVGIQNQRSITIMRIEVTADRPSKDLRNCHPSKVIKAQLARGRNFAKAICSLYIPNREEGYHKNVFVKTKNPEYLDFLNSAIPCYPCLYGIRAVRKRNLFDLSTKLCFQKSMSSGTIGGSGREEERKDRGWWWKG